MNLNKDAASWAKVLPPAVLTGSAQQSLNVLTMALEDIQRLAQNREVLLTVIGHLQTERDEARAALKMALEDIQIIHEANKDGDSICIEAICDLALARSAHDRRQWGE